MASIRRELVGTYCAVVMTAVAGWLKSPGYCRNILMPELREIGVGVVVQPSGERRSYGVQKFGAQ